MKEGKNKLICLYEKLENSINDLDIIESFVNENKNLTIKINDFELMVCSLSETEYAGEQYMFESWEELYLPEPVRMSIIGVLKFSEYITQYPDWVILISVNGHVYGFDSYQERINLLAENLKDFITNDFNVIKFYEYPDDISDDENYEDEETKEIKQKTDEFINSKAEHFNKFMNKYFKS